MMMRNEALEFSKAVSDLWLMENICDRSASLELDEQQVRDTKLNVQNVLENIKRICVRSNLGEAIGPELDRFQAALQSKPLADLAQRCDHLRNRLLDELAQEFYFQVHRQDVQLYKQSAPFGEAVAKKFNRAAADIQNAGNCLALQQPTACVFHLMRAVEIAVRQLSKRLNVTITPQSTWRQMTGQMDPKIKSMPAATESQKRKKNNWEAASMNLHHVGSVWRNNTMHPAASYTQDEARDVFTATRVFMNGLCDL
jgi:hypothetical protein